MTVDPVKLFEAIVGRAERLHAEVKPGGDGGRAAVRYVRLVIRDAERVAQQIAHPAARGAAFGGLACARAIDANPRDQAARAGAGRSGRALLAHPEAGPRKAAARWIGEFLSRVGELPLPGAA